MGQPGLDRRQLLAALGGLTVAGSFGFAALGTGADALASGADRWLLRNREGGGR
ncbi:hypothetical protein [Streptomyces sp. NPDC048584]|uniref:hypothetical protein n=1 Tax=Streptomyces sp. NPDC048584 TaxID=3365573 RepID=UPI0037160886